MYLERTLLNYNNQKHSMFLFAYRAFIEALATKDTKTLKKMTEKNLYNALVRDQKKFDELDFEYTKVDKKIQMKMRLLDL